MFILNQNHDFDVEMILISKIFIPFIFLIWYLLLHILIHSDIFIILVVCVFYYVEQTMTFLQYSHFDDFQVSHTGVFWDYFQICHDMETIINEDNIIRDKWYAYNEAIHEVGTSL
jgi:hypothetical protein